METKIKRNWKTILEMPPKNHRHPLEKFLLPWAYGDSFTENHYPTNVWKEKNSNLLVLKGLQSWATL